MDSEESAKPTQGESATEHQQSQRSAREACLQLALDGVVTELRAELSVHGAEVAGVLGRVGVPAGAARDRREQLRVGGNGLRSGASAGALAAWATRSLCGLRGTSSR